MAPMVTLYILAGCVGVAAALFVIMILLSVVRPPRLPDLRSEPPPPPLQRVIRALTPPPIVPQLAHATPLPGPLPSAPTKMLRVAAPVTAPPMPPPPPRPAAPALPPPPPPVSLPIRPPRAQRAPLAYSPISMPRYPAKRSRWLRRVVLGLFVTSALASVASIAHPALLDPMCDDYEWFGADAASAAREQAQLAHDTICDWLGI
jgi:hypothetical protein